MAGTWLDQVVWSVPRTIADVNENRSLIPKEKGYYAFIEGCRQPAADCTLYIGIALGRNGLAQRLPCYLKANVSVAESESIGHAGKRLLEFARIRGLMGLSSPDATTSQHDRFIHVCWAVAPFIFTGEPVVDPERRYAFDLERALVDWYRPVFNTANWTRDLAFEMDDEAF